MPKHRWWLFSLPMTAAIAGLIYRLGAYPTPSPAPAQRLPDGSVLTLEAVTYGRNHDFVRGTWWQKLLDPVLPFALKNRFGMMFRGHQPAHPKSLVFWTLREVPWRPTGAAPSWEARAVVFDEHGCAAETPVRVIGAGASYGSPVLEAWEIPAFPRDGKQVGLRLYTVTLDGRWIPAAEFVRHNPTPGPHPTWSPQALPITKRQGDLAFTLTAFSTGVRETGLPNPPSPVEAWTEATFRVTDRGKPTAAWEPADVVLSDATGNVWRPAVCLHEPWDRRFRLYFRGALWGREAAWKLRVEFVRAADPSPETLWTARGVGVPPAGLFARSSATAARQGVKLRVRGISGANAGPRAPLGIRYALDVPTVHVRLSPPPQGTRLRLVRATDDQGRPCALSRPQGGFLGHYSFRVGIPPGAQAVDLSFAVHKQSRFVEFIAAPRRPSGTAP